MYSEYIEQINGLNMDLPGVGKRGQSPEEVHRCNEGGHKGLV